MVCMDMSITRSMGVPSLRKAANDVAVTPGQNSQQPSRVVKCLDEALVEMPPSSRLPCCLH